MGPSLRLVVAEAGGEQEELNGTPLIGPSGKVFDMLLRKAGVYRDQVSVANTLSCRPPNNIYPTDAAARQYCTDTEAATIVKHCFEHHLAPVLQARPWERIDAIGDKSLRVLTGKTDGIMKWRGSPLPLIGQKTPKVIGLLHPSYLMRDAGMIPSAISDLAKTINVPPQHYNLQPTLEDLEGFHPDILYTDIETNRFTNQITMVGIALGPHRVIVVPFQGAYIAQLKRIFLEANQIVNQNIIAFDLPILAENGIHIHPDCKVWDIMLLHHLVAPDEPHDLEYIATICTSMVAWKHLKGQDERWYNACDVDAVAQIFAVLLPRVKYLKLLDLYLYVQQPLARICKLMHDTGIKMDPNRIKVKRAEFLKEFVELEAKLPPELQPYDRAIKIRQKAPVGTIGKAGKPVKFIHTPGTERVVPWQSSSRVATYLYETLGLPKQLHRKTKKVTTDKQSLERLFRQTKNPALDALRKIRQLDELLSTFLKEPNATTQSVTRIHSNFLVHGTATGRLASSGPNMQNIPSKARYIYVPSHSDWCFVEADFSSLENRLAAWYANDTDRLARLSMPGFNEHLWLARQIYGEQVTKDDPEYKLGKITNHGADGAMGARKLSQTHDLPEKLARELILSWRKINWKSATWQEEAGNAATLTGQTVNAFGRKRWYWSKSGYTEGIRFFPQSTGADICFRAMIGMMYERIDWPVEFALKASPVLLPLPRPARLVLQVHDSLLIECPLALVDEVARCLKVVMEQPWEQLGGFSIPCEVKVGEPSMSWAELTPYKIPQ